MTFDHTHTSALVENMKHEADQMETFPVLIGDEVAHFHDVSGGYHRQRRYEVVNLIHEVQGPGSPYMVDTEQMSTDIEAHLCDNYYYLDALALRTSAEYPDEDYVLSIKVNDNMRGKYSFSSALSSDIDRREQRFSSNDE